MSAQNVALLRMAGRLVDVSGRSGQTHFEDQIRGVWASALSHIPHYLSSHPALAEQFAQQLAHAASRPQHATLLFALLDEGGKDTIVGEFFQNAEIEQLAQLGASNPDILRLLARVSGGEEAAEPESNAAPLIEFGLASVAVPVGDPAAGSAVVTETHVFPCAWEGPDSPGVLRDLVRIHEALTRNGLRKPLERYGQPQIELWLASEPEGKTAKPVVAQPPVAAPAPAVTPNAPVLVNEATPFTLPVAKPAPMPPKPAPSTAAPTAPPSAAARPAASASRPKAAAFEKPARANSFDPEEEAEEGEVEGNRTAVMAGVAAVVVLAVGVGVYFLMGSGAKAIATPPNTTAPAAAPARRSNTREASTAPAGRTTDAVDTRESPPLNATGATAANPASPVPGSVKSGSAQPGPAVKSVSSTAPTAGALVQTPIAPPATTPPPAQIPAAETGDRRAAALDALGLPGNGAEAEAEQKRKNALKALTGQ